MEVLFLLRLSFFAKVRQKYTHSEILKKRISISMFSSSYFALRVPSIICICDESDTPDINQVSFFLCALRIAAVCNRRCFRDGRIKERRELLCRSRQGGVCTGDIPANRKNGFHPENSYRQIIRRAATGSRRLL